MYFRICLFFLLSGINAFLYVAHHEVPAKKLMFENQDSRSKIDMEEENRRASIREGLTSKYNNDK